MKNSSKLLSQDTEISENCFINLKLIEILEVVSYQHPYNSQYLAFYCLIIWYRKIMCMHETDRQAKLDFFNCTGKNKDQDQLLDEMCLCRGCDLYDDYVTLFSENKWLLQQIFEIVKPSLNRQSEYSLGQIEKIIKQLYLHYIKKWPDQKIVLTLFFVFNLKKFYAHNKDISFSQSFASFKEESRKEQQKKIINDLIQKLGFEKKEKDTYKIA